MTSQPLKQTKHAPGDLLASEEQRAQGHEAPLSFRVSSPKLWFQALIGLIVGAGAIYYLLHSVDIRQTSREMMSIPWWSHLLFVLILLLQVLVRTGRWSLQIRGSSRTTPTLRESFAVNAGAFAAVFLLPFRLGEFIRPWLCQKKQIADASESLAHSLLERIVDGLVMTLCLAALLIYLPEGHLPLWLYHAGWSALGLFGGVACVLVLGLAKRSFVLQTCNSIIGALNQTMATKVVRLLEGFFEGVRCYRHLGDFITYVCLSVFYWGLNALGCWVLLVALTPEATFLMALFMLCFLVIAVMIPAPPGNVGNFHVFGQSALVLMGLSSEKALAAVTVVHGWQSLFLLCWALIFVASGDLSQLSSLKSERKRHASQ
jgi:glycosyltransferase 2 family protein